MDTFEIYFGKKKVLSRTKMFLIWLCKALNSTRRYTLPPVIARPFISISEINFKRFILSVIEFQSLKTLFVGIGALNRAFASKLKTSSWLKWLCKELLAIASMIVINVKIQSIVWERRCWKLQV